MFVTGTVPVAVDQAVVAVSSFGMAKEGLPSALIFSANPDTWLPGREMTV